MAGFDDYLSVLDDNELEEKPVDIDTFVSDERFLGKRKMRLSPIQRECVSMMTQIYKQETLVKFLEPKDVQKRMFETRNEIILMLGKGSGKDELSAMAIAYIVYLLLCLKDPAAYYGKPAGDTIDILNIAINASQAHQVFFKKFKNYISVSPWFQDKYDAKPDGDPSKSDQFNFIKNINVYSGHSERESWEGYNVFAVVLDEISGFAIESASPTGKTAQAIYDMYKASVVSRFAKYGKTICLSFPRFKGDFITQRYDAVVGGKQTIIRSETLKINDEFPDGYEGNEITIEWEEDHIDFYKERKVFALKRPPWDVNPTVEIYDYVDYFVANYIDAMGRFACMPPDAIDAFFRDRNRIETAFAYDNGWDHSEGRYRDESIFKPDPTKTYFVHVDLAQKHDRCAVAMSHVERWVREEMGGKISPEAKPFVKVDLIRYWEPKLQGEVDFDEVQEFIVDLQRKGFNLGIVTFDQWRSEDMRKYLNTIGIRSDLLSIKKEQYVDFTVVMHAGRLQGPKEDKLIEELLQLRLFPNGKIDHIRKGYKDISDATCGSIFNSVTRTPRTLNQTVEVLTRDDFKMPIRNTIDNKDVIVAPSIKERMPQEIRSYLESIKVI